MRDRWLAGLVCTALGVEAEAVLAELRRRGLRPRSVPTGPARGAWTCAAGPATVAVVVSGRGDGAARATAGFWAPRTRSLLLCQALPATAVVDRPSLAVDGDPGLVAAIAAQAARTGGDRRPGGVASVQAWSLGPEARASLAASGFAAAGPEVEAWRSVAIASALPFAVAAGLLDPEAARRTMVATGQAGPPWWRVVRPAARARLRAGRDTVRVAADLAAPAVIAALLGP